MNRGTVMFIGCALLAAGSGAIGYLIASKKYTRTIVSYDRLSDITTESLKTALNSNIDLNLENQQLKLRNKELETRIENLHLV